MCDRNGAKLRDEKLNLFADQTIDCIYTSNELVIFDQSSKSLIAYMKDGVYVYEKGLCVRPIIWLYYSHYM